MKVLVTGAAGQVGCRLVRQLLDLNYEVRGSVLPDDPFLNRLDGLDVEILDGDLTDGEFAGNAVSGTDAVIHTANLVGPWFEINTQINLEVSRACGQFADSLERYVYVSSSGVFPNNGENIACAYHPVDEMHPKRPDNEYSLSKYIGELMAERMSRETGLRISIVRPSHVLSGSSIFDQFTVGRVCAILKAGQVGPRTEMFMADGTELWHEIEARSESSDQPCAVRDEAGRPWYYQPNDARDIAHCIVCALRSPDAVGESFNGGAPAPFTYPEGARLLGEIRRREPLEAVVPVRWMYDHDITKAKTLIGYRPTGDLDTMMASAAAFEAGEPDYQW